MICVCSQAQVDGVQDEDFTVDFLSILPDHPAFLYELNGLGKSKFRLRYVVFKICQDDVQCPGGSVGLSPCPVAWASFLSQHGNKYFFGKFNFAIFATELSSKTLASVL